MFYGYDPQGFKASWIGTFYDFHLAAHGVMVINVYGGGVAARSAFSGGRR